MISPRDQFIDNWRRHFALLQMTLDGCKRNFGEHESGAANLGSTSLAKNIPGKLGQAFLEALRLFANAALELLRPVALDEIMPTVEHEQSRVFQMGSRPGRRVEGGGKAVASGDRCHESTRYCVGLETEGRNVKIGRTRPQIY